MNSDRDLQPLLDIRQNQLAIIFEDSNSIDTKALALVGANIAVLIYLAQASLTTHHQWLAVALIISYLASIFAAISALWPYAYQGAGVSLADHPEYLELDSENLVLQLIADTEQAINKNSARNHMRWQATLASFALAIIGTLGLFAILKA